MSSKENKFSQKTDRTPAGYANSSSSKAIAETFLDEAKKTLSIDAGLIYLIDEKEDNYVLIADYGFGENIKKILRVLPIAKILEADVPTYPSPRLYNLKNARSKKLPFAEAIKAEGFQWVGYCAIGIAGRKLGAIITASHEHPAKKEIFLEKIIEMTETTAFHFFNAAIIERDRKRAKGLEEVLETSVELGRAENLKGIADILAAKYTSIANATYSSVALMTDSGKSLELMAVNSARPLKTCAAIGTKLSLEDDSTFFRGLLNCEKNALFEIRSPFPDLSNMDKNFLLTPSTQTAIILPLLAGDEIVGIVTICEERRPERNSFDENSMKVVHILARQAGVAIENMKLLKKVLDEKRFIDLLVKNATVLVVVTDELGRVKTLNHVAETTTGLKQDEVTDTDVFNLLFLPEKVDEVKKQFAATVYKGKPLSFHSDMKTKRGGNLLVQWNCTPLEVEGSSGTRIVMIGADNTDLVHGYGDLEKAHAQLTETHHKLKNAMEKLQMAYSTIIQQDKMAAIGQLAAGMAHEINNPNAFILSNLSTLEEYTKDIFAALNEAREIAAKYAPQDEMERLEKIEKDLAIDMIRDDYKQLLAESSEGAERISQLVKELGVFSNGKEKNKKLLDLGDVIKNCMNVIKNNLKYKASLEVEITLLPSILGNRAALGQAFFNITMNAIDFFDEKKAATNKLKIEAWEENDHVVVTIKDNGPGIAPENIGRIFEPFFTTKEVGQGTGMGLAVVHDIVTKNSGSIEVKSKLNEGTIFTLRFPKATCDSDDEPYYPVADESGSIALQPDLYASADLKKVLVVDDEELILDLVKSQLELKYNAVTCESGAEALEILKEDRGIAAIICDINLRDMDGDALYRAAVKIAPQIKKHFIFISGGIFDDKVEKFIEKKNIPLLKKPFRREKILEILAKTIE